ncbi:MAG: hypothetical protein M3Y59_20505 [Myxococcota bacterium]|nr:hypothetical protein [Myxococcota bacterium]
MATSQWAYLLLLVLISAERLFELWLSRRNARRALLCGGREVGQGHFRVMTLMHVGFLVACAAEVVLLDRPFRWSLGAPMLALAALSQALRYWAITTLGDRWNTRIIFVPDAPPVTSGPYRFLRHPNYLAVVVELAALPLIHGAYLTAVVFSLLNAAVLFVRIRAEEQALGSLYQNAFATRSRLLPGRRG